ncbi:restriction endonuclease subunit S [Helicobacter typhlonius]|uniref:restriction endonuclease subunit S n=1 Tax=Helicobacter typhlonius TaxID=76936 RepID=UPI002FE0F52E
MLRIRATHKIYSKKHQYSNEYEIPVLTAGKSFLLGYTNDTENIFTQTPVIIFDDFTTDSKFVDFHFKVKSSAMKILHATKIANIKFVFYFMQTIQYRSDTHKRYWISEYAKLPIPLPPIEVQKAIVEKLENAFAHIDEAVHHLKAVQTNIPLLKSSLLHCAFSGKLTESQNQSHEVQTLKSVVGVEGEFERKEGDTSPFKPPHPLIKTEIPQGWEIKTLGEVCEILDNMRKPINADERGQRLKKAENRYPYYGATGQVGYIDDYLCDFEAILLGEDGAPFLEFMKNKAYIVSGKYWVNNHAHILKTKENIANNKFICHFLNILDYTPYVSGTTRLKLNQSSMKQIKIPLPPLETQNQIVQILESKFAHLEKLAQFVNESLENLQRLKSSLLNQAFKGELIC